MNEPLNLKTALACAVLSQEVYEDFKEDLSDELRFREWPQTRPVFIDDPSTDTQLAILDDPAQDFAVIVFRGTEAEQDWNTNIRLNTREYEWTTQEKAAYSEEMKAVANTVEDDKMLVYPEEYGQSSQPVKMHSGFIRAYLSVRDRIHQQVKASSTTRYRITGHSMGGAIAKLCAVDLHYNFIDKSDKITALETYSFGAPRVGNRAFADSYNRRVPNTWRVVNGWDVIVGLPVPWQGYRHVEKAFKMERRFTWRIITGSVQDHRIANYIQALQNRLSA